MEHRFNDLIRKAAEAGVRVVMHESPDCRVLLVPEQRQLWMHSRISLAERYRILCESLRRVGLGGLIDRPVRKKRRHGVSPGSWRLIPVDPGGGDSEHASNNDPTPAKRLEVHSRRTSEWSMADALIDECGETLPDDPRLTAWKRSQGNARPRYQPPVDRCTLCPDPVFARIERASLCRKHLVQFMDRVLSPSQVRSLRMLAPSTEELGPEYYDGQGWRRRTSRIPNLPCPPSGDDV